MTVRHVKVVWILVRNAAELAAGREKVAAERRRWPPRMRVILTFNKDAAEDVRRIDWFGRVPETPSYLDNRFLTAP
jgi:hypothetical protein